MLEDSPDSPFAKFIATAFTSDQRELIEDLKPLFFKRLHEDKALKFQEDVAFSEANIPADAGAYIAHQVQKAKHDETQAAVEVCRNKIVKLIEINEHET